MIRRTHQRPDLPGTAIKGLGVVFGLVFVGGGLSFLGAVWTSGAPTFFRLFASCISIGIVSMGAFTCFAAFTGRGMRGGRNAGSPSSAKESPTYACPNCGATLASQADVSPHGDVKCGYCDRWFNIHHAE